MLNIFVLLIIAVSLSMDTFSLSIIYGTMNFSKRKIYLLSVVVGIFHFLMPFLGNLIGLNIINKLPISSNVLVGLIFIIIAFQMLLQKDEIVEITHFFSILFFAFTVSIDSFSVGIGISSITSNYVLAYSIFSITSLLFTYVGLLFGKILHSYLGTIATKFGSIILIILGIIYVF